MQTPQVLFDDRLLTCSDCSGEFIFTAGEQLFFHDKQFKNDPKRCKPCKSRRSGLAAAANGTGPAAAGISRTETRTECSDCGIQTTVPFKPTQGRPVLCRQCFQVKAKAAQPAEAPILSAPVPPQAVPQPSAYAVANAEMRAHTVSALTEASTEANGLHLSHEAATLAAASMAGAHAHSSVATLSELISLLAEEPQPDEEQRSPSGVPIELLQHQDRQPDLLLATADAAEA